MKNKKTSSALAYIVLTLIAIIFVIPLLWVFVASFDANATQVLKMPEHFTLTNYQEVITDRGNQQAFLNGLFLSGGQTILVVLFSLLAAYPLSRFPLKNKQKLLMTILFMTSLPITAVMVPVYQLFTFFNLTDSLVGTLLFLTASSLPFGIWMMKNFMDGVPIELEESAWIDGASKLSTLYKVIVPLMKSGMYTVAIFTFIGSWGNFFVPYILLSSPKKLPASVTLFQFFGQYGYAAYGQLAAYSVLYMLPTFILYYFSQNHMSKGFNMGGAAKG
ncbi:carbohydrate ABC transporter permease [Pisciglobus halotolerans]|uniref:Carbohydrate ABC transporter membrane protein 2, CUT1 family n=1 Tax=Pisciglobus halotolerans TaxID=745365 RepID=A0A1I3C674_9LACT|nr:carbohydrate ABC transporter permease [Pisciglobus halotolerans]SFH70032.1 carbohydrate ABC transporter membrane protein 2, CUT1 family [Pisciglobus halotolerans]